MMAKVRAAKSKLALLILADAWRIEQWLSYQYLQGSHRQDQVRGGWPPVGTHFAAEMAIKSFYIDSGIEGKSFTLFYYCK